MTGGGRIGGTGMGTARRARKPGTRFAIVPGSGPGDKRPLFATPPAQPWGWPVTGPRGMPSFPGVPGRDGLQRPDTLSFQRSRRTTGVLPVIDVAELAWSS